MRRQDGNQPREDEPTRPVRVPLLRPSPETEKAPNVVVDANEPATSDAPPPPPRPSR